jgi:HD-GYP domain-containing protein (c-di-GMP phosphodiesterase class II)
MAKSMDTKKLEIFKMEHKKSLEMKLAKLRDTISEDDVSLEKEMIKMFSVSLLAHGKDKKLMRQIVQISRVLGESLGLGTAYCDRLEQAAKIYDIGNVMICKEVYEKEEKLSFEEFKVVKNHTFIGYYLLKAQGFPITDLAAIISSEHHEWWNGGGYPAQKKAHDINIASRIVAVADTVGALFRKRPDRTAWEYKKILEYVETRSGIQFDPEVVAVFLINQEIIYEILHADL